MSLFNSIEQAFGTFDVLVDNAPNVAGLRFPEISPVFERRCMAGE